MVIAIQPTMFTRDAKVVILDEEMKSVQATYKFPVNELSVQIPALCKDSKIDKVLLIGNKNFTAKIGDAIKTNAISQYSYDIKIEYTNR